MDEISSGTFDELMQFLDSIAWFNIFANQKENCIEAMRNWYPNYRDGYYYPQDPTSVLYVFPNFFDPETIYQEGDYIDLLQDLAQYSCGLFEISNPFEKWTETTGDAILITLRFSINGTTLEKTWEHGGEFVDRAFFDLLAEGLKTCDPPLDQIATTGGNDCVYIVNDARVIRKLKAYFPENCEFYWIST